MAEAFLVLGIAANIAQFVGLGLQLVSQGKEIHGSIHGAPDAHLDIQVIADDIRNVAVELEASTLQSRSLTSPPSSDQAALTLLAARCQPLAEELLRVLEDLKVRKSARFRTLEAVRQTFRSATKSNDVQELKGRLLDLDRRLRARASVMLQK